MSLNAWVKKVGGATKAARLLNVDIRSVNNWRAGNCLPTFKNLQKIEKLSRGSCRAVDIVAEYANRRK